MTEQQIKKLAVNLAREIFKCGDFPGSPVQRIEFKSGIYPHEENKTGGLVEEALAYCIAKALEKHLPNL